MKKHSLKENQNAVRITNITHLVVFIIGPYASKWFNDAQTFEAMRFDNETTWILAPTVDEFNRRLYKVETAEENTDVRILFPFLPDGHENDSIVFAQLTAWEHAFSSLKRPQPLPCIFVIYARLSEQRFSHDPDRAFWIGEFDISNAHKTHFEQEFQLVREQLKHKTDDNNHHAIQRYVMTDALFSWLETPTIKNALQSLFQTSPFYLSGVILSDHGTGFTRHGAWSRWMSEQYAILPGLSATISVPPLPNINRSAYQSKTLPYIEPENTAKPIKWLWLLTVITVLLASIILFTVWREVRLIEKVKKHIDNFENIEALDSLKKYNNFNVLINDKKYLSDCSKARDLYTLGLSKCSALFSLVQKSISDYDPKSAYIVPTTVPLFNHGSAQLNVNSEPGLFAILPLITNNRETRFLITGHSDNTGNKEANIALSEQRALTIRDWIIRQTHLPASHFVIKGVGDSKPIADNQSESGREKNRRVEITPLITENMTVE